MMSITLFFSELKMIVNKRDTTEYVFPDRVPPLLAIILALFTYADKLFSYTLVAIIYYLFLSFFNSSAVSSLDTVIFNPVLTSPVCSTLES